MAIDEDTQRHLLILSGEALPVRLGGFSEFVVSSRQFCCTICNWCKHYTNPTRFTSDFSRVAQDLSHQANK